MTNLDTSPRRGSLPRGAGRSRSLRSVVARARVPLGGVRAMNVMRTLPQRGGLPTVGAWCFLDSFGPDRVAMSVLPPHPHCGLQTVTWPPLEAPYGTATA